MNVKKRESFGWFSYDVTLFIQPITYFRTVNGKNLKQIETKHIDSP